MQWIYFTQAAEELAAAYTSKTLRPLRAKFNAKICAEARIARPQRGAARLVVRVRVRVRARVLEVGVEGDTRGGAGRGDVERAGAAVRGVGWRMSISQMMAMDGEGVPGVPSRLALQELRQPATLPLASSSASSEGPVQSE
jgi:hypothetical protein